MNCPYCGTTDTAPFYAAEMPNVLSACPAEMLSRVKRHHFTASVCRSCMLGFNTSRLADEELREIYDHYLYISPARGIGHSKYDGMIGMLRKTFAATDRIVEIGCSEGYLLNQLKTSGYQDLTGVEPGPQAGEAESMGLRVVRSYFDGCQWPEGSVDGFYLMHVFEHFPDPFSVLRTMHQALSPHGSIVIEVPNFEGFHHQHLYFYSAPFMRRLSGEMNLKIVELEKTAGILRVVFAHPADPRPEITHESEDVLERARQKRNEFAASVARLETLLNDHAGKTLYWWGAGSQTVVCLNQVSPSSLAQVALEITDGDLRKWGYYIPGPNIEVKPYNALAGCSVDCLVIASEFHNEIRQTMDGIGLSAGRIEIFN